MDRLTELNTFVAVVEHGGFAAASRALHRSPPTITRIVGDLEARLGVRLLDRTSRRCAPTEAGRRLADDARNLLADYDQALGAAAEGAAALRGTLRITASHFFGRAHVAPLVMSFVGAHPDIYAELDLSDRPADLHGEGLDLAVRIGPISDLSLTARRVGSVRRVIVASPAYLAARGVPRTAADLEAHDLIQYGPQSDLPWTLMDPDGRPAVVRTRPRFTVNQADAKLDAARAGRGLVSALSYQVHDDLIAGTLVKVMPDHEPEVVPVQLAWCEGRERLQRVRALIDHLVEGLRKVPAIHQS
jgi:DNA-binding transcriptional LysR family regulator